MQPIDEFLDQGEPKNIVAGIWRSIEIGGDSYSFAWSYFRREDRADAIMGDYSLVRIQQVIRNMHGVGAFDRPRLAAWILDVQLS